MNTPVCDFIRNYAASDTVRMHMPGHKGVSVTGWENRDITEVAGVGELYTSEGSIGEGEANTAALFGTAKTCWVTEGSSQCIRAMLALAAGFGSNAAPVILAARNAHRSFLTACALLDLTVEWLWPSGRYSLCACPVTPGQVDLALQNRKPLPAAVYLTSPDYLGGIQDIRGIAEVCHRYGVPLLVDNAHGSYLHFLREPCHPIDLGADLCCDSAHKTLPALTGCAYLHIAKQAPQRFARHAKTALSLFGSTSPSWLLLQSLDAVNPLLEAEFPHRLTQVSGILKKIKSELSELGWEFFGEEPLKLTISAAKAGYSGSELAALLRSAGIEPEYADPDYLVLMASPWTPCEDLQRVYEALSSIPLRPERVVPVFSPKAPKAVLSPRKAMLAPQETLPAEQCIGRILASPALSCPPAIPVIVSGEMVPAEVLPILEHYDISELTVVSNE